MIFFSCRSIHYHCHHRQQEDYQLGVAIDPYPHYQSVHFEVVMEWGYFQIPFVLPSFTVVEFVAARLMMIVQIIFVVFRKLEIVFLIIVIAINRERGTTQDKPLVHIQLLYSIFVQTQIK
ncbi:hypothetical protein P8452_63595 [Trifolium repens]|nr:hypothetical protein P8452_63595 [Trifolium repens]